MSDTLALLLDTSVLIALADPAQAQHACAHRYFREAMRAGVPLYLSVIAAAEFQPHQAVTDLPLRNLTVLPFNIDHAIAAGELARQLAPEGLHGLSPNDTAAVRDDLKLVAQAMCEDITHILVEGEGALARLVRQLHEAGRCRLGCILLSQGYDGAWLNGGQKDLLPDEPTAEPPS